MGDLNGIPEKDIEKLSKYLGREKALEYVKKVKYNYQAVSTKLLLLNLREYAKREPVLFWVCVSIFLLLLGYRIFKSLYY